MLSNYQQTLQFIHELVLPDHNSYKLLSNLFKAVTHYPKSLVLFFTNYSGMHTKEIKTLMNKISEKGTILSIGISSEHNFKYARELATHYHPVSGIELNLGDYIMDYTLYNRPEIKFDQTTIPLQHSGIINKYYAFTTNKIPKHIRLDKSPASSSEKTQFYIYLLTKAIKYCIYDNPTYDGISNIIQDFRSLLTKPIKSPQEDYHISEMNLHNYYDSICSYFNNLLNTLIATDRNEYYRLGTCLSNIPKLPNREISANEVLQIKMQDVIESLKPIEAFKAESKDLLELVDPCVISINDFIDCIYEKSCLCICLDLDFDSNKINSIYNVFISFDAYKNSFKGPSGNINCVFPLYICESHWQITKLKYHNIIKSCGIKDIEAFTMLVLYEALIAAHQNPNNCNTKNFDLILTTCMQAIKTFNWTTTLKQNILNMNIEQFIPRIICLDLPLKLSSICRRLFQSHLDIKFLRAYYSNTVNNDKTLIEQQSKLIRSIDLLNKWTGLPKIKHLSDVLDELIIYPAIKPNFNAGYAPAFRLYHFKYSQLKEEIALCLKNIKVGHPVFAKFLEILVDPQAALPYEKILALIDKLAWRPNRKKLNKVITINYHKYNNYKDVLIFDKVLKSDYYSRHYINAGKLFRRY